MDTEKHGLTLNLFFNKKQFGSGSSGLSSKDQPLQPLQTLQTDFYEWK